MDYIQVALNHKLVVKLAPCKLSGMDRSSSNKHLQAHERGRCIRTRTNHHNSVKLPEPFQPVRRQLNKYRHITINAQPKPLVKLPFPSLKQVKMRLKFQEDMTFGQKMFKMKKNSTGLLIQLDDVTPRFGGATTFILA